MDLLPNKSDAVLLPITNTRISASEWNQLVGSCMAFIYAAGFSPDAADNEQFLNAFKKIASELELVGANTALSNLTSAGQEKFDAKANVSLDNLSSAGDIYGSKLCMPSTTTKALTIGASGSTYTAPANGWAYFSTWTTATPTAYFQLSNLTTNIGILPVPNQGEGYQQKGYIPCRKGDTIYLAYSNLDMSLSELKFVYAEGSKSEAN